MHCAETVLGSDSVMADGHSEDYESLGGCGLWFLSAGIAAVIAIIAALALPYDLLSTISAISYLALFAIIRFVLGSYARKTEERRARQSRDP